MLADEGHHTTLFSAFLSLFLFFSPFLFFLPFLLSFSSFFLLSVRFSSFLPFILLSLYLHSRNLFLLGHAGLTVLSHFGLLLLVYLWLFVVIYPSLSLCSFVHIFPLHYLFLMNPFKMYAHILGLGPNYRRAYKKVHTHLRLTAK